MQYVEALGFGLCLSVATATGPPWDDSKSWMIDGLKAANTSSICMVALPFRTTEAVSVGNSKSSMTLVLRRNRTLASALRTLGGSRSEHAPLLRRFSFAYGTPLPLSGA
jgi:hypothetical protein